MATIYKVPMKKSVLAVFLAFVMAVAAAVTWSFNSGLTWTGICLIVVAAPLAMLYWYMLYINPKRAAITVADEGILLSAPPFASAVIPWAAVEKTFTGNMVADETLKVKKAKKIMQFAGYRNGIVELESSREAVVVANQPNVLCIQTADRYYLLGPSDLEQFTQEVQSILGG